MATPKEYKGAAEQLTLSGDISAGSTSFSSVETPSAGWPTGSGSKPFIVRIDNEKILCSARSGGTFTVAGSGTGRGYDGTEAADHTGNVASIRHTLDAESHQEFNDHINNAAHAHTTAMITDLAEYIRDTVGAAIAAGNNIDVTVSDPSDTITIDVEGLTSADISDLAEFIRDTVAAALVAGPGMDIDVSDGSDTITINNQAYVPGTYVYCAGSTAPTEVYPDGRLVLLPCDGAAVSRSTYAALFAKIGEDYGVGNGTTTFNVPDAEEKFLLGSGVGYAIGSTGGQALVSLVTSQMPAHTHTGPAHTHTGPSHTHSGPSHSHAVSDDAHAHFGSYVMHGGSTDFLAIDGVVGVDYGTFGGGRTTSGNTGNAGTGNTGAGGTGATSSDGTGDTGSAGSGTAHENMPPYLVALICIAT